MQSRQQVDWGFEGQTPVVESGKSRGIVRTRSHSLVERHIEPAYPIRHEVFRYHESDLTVGTEVDLNPIR